MFSLFFPLRYNCCEYKFIHTQKKRKKCCQNVSKLSNPGNLNSTNCKNAVRTRLSDQCSDISIGVSSVYKSGGFLRCSSTLEHIFYSYVRISPDQRNFNCNLYLLQITVKLQRIIAKIDDLNNVAVF